MRSHPYSLSKGMAWSHVFFKKSHKVLWIGVVVGKCQFYSVFQETDNWSSNHGVGSREGAKYKNSKDIKARYEERLSVRLREMRRGCLIDFWHEQLGGWQCQGIQFEGVIGKAGAAWICFAVAKCVSFVNRYWERALSYIDLGWCSCKCSEWVHLGTVGSKRREPRLRG